jgi:hypothetical protein|tara:strand:+ start:434 stop:1399 length:966 start_codon:yes stop_codon:yes gene_type:complete
MKNANKNEGDEIMNNMKQKSKNENMIQLTMSNAVDQTKKIRIEVPAGTSIAQAAKDSGIAPKGAFDVFTPGGEAVTQMSVDRHRDAVLYIGPQKVAGGANDEFILDPEPGDEIEDGPQMGPKFICFTSAYDPTVRHDVVPQDDQTVKQAAQMAGMGPRDQSAWSVFDADGTTVDNQPASELTGEVLYVGPTAIDAGAIDIAELSGLRGDFPSIKVIKGQKRNNIKLFYLQIKDQKNRAIGGRYECVVDVRAGLANLHTHILNLKPNIRHPHVYTNSLIPGTNHKSFTVCQGDCNNLLINSKPSSAEKLGAYLNHIASVLNS